jgi:acyl carrier protein
LTREQIFEDLRATMVELFELSPDAVTLEAGLREDLDLDSIDAIDMAARLHRLTGRKLDMSSLKKLTTVSDVVDLVEAHLRAS